MHLRILLPFLVFADHGDVLSMVVETRAGSFGILPHRLDCVAALVPGIMVFRTTAAGEAMVAVDGGMLVKIGTEVIVSVRRAVIGADLGRLRTVIEREYESLDDNEQSARTVVARLESAFLSNIANLKHG
jgi:F-type H+-transporting ATPase subunit epsilon